MGHKTLKEHYRITHMVQVTDNGICIGSPYIHNLIVVSRDGVLQKAKHDFTRSNADLTRYMAEMQADPAKLREVVQAPDQFAAAVTVYTYEGGSIIEKLCEVPGWPNVTHDGAIMYENTYSTDRAKMVAWAKDNAQAGVDMWTRQIEQDKAKLAQSESYRQEAAADLAKLNADYPATGCAPAEGGAE